MSNSPSIDLPLNTAIVVLAVVAIVALAWPAGVLLKSRFGDLLDSRQPNGSKDTP
jgi:hypothetical protein